MKWIKASERLPIGVTSFNTMSNYVAVHYYSGYSKQVITACGRYCHDRKEWFIGGTGDRDVKNIIEWLDESPSAPVEQEGQEDWKGVEELLRLSVGLDPYRSNKIVDYLQSKYTIIKK